MSWASVASVAQLAASLALMLRLLVATADPTTQMTDEQIFERTTYMWPFSPENDSDIGGNFDEVIARCLKADRPAQNCASYSGKERLLRETFRVIM